EHRRRRAVHTKRTGHLEALIEHDGRFESLRLVIRRRPHRYNQELGRTFRRLGLPGFYVAQHLLAEAAARIPEEQKRWAATKIGQRDHVAREGWQAEGRGRVAD